MEIHQELETLFAELAASQEPLGQEFEQVLMDNLWGLYSEQ